MTREELYRGIENIDEDLINDADFSPKKRPNKKWIFAVAACLCLIIGITAIMNINTSTEVKANREVIEQGEYYQIFEIKRVFQNGFHKSESIQYNYVVYNGKFVLASGVSMKKPEVHNLSETVICIEHSDYTQEYMTYCDLTINDMDHLVSNWTIKKEQFVLEYEGYLVYLDSWDDDETYDVVWIDSIDDKYLNLLEIFDLNSKNTDISVSLNDNKTRIKVSYTDSEGKISTKFIKIPKNKKNKKEIVINTSEVDCIWKDRLVDQTQYTYTYNVYFTINREVEEPFYDLDEEDELYQCFVLINNKIIDEGCYLEYAPEFQLVEDDVLVMKFNCGIDAEEDGYGQCRFYKISTGEISPKYTNTLFTVDGIVAESSFEKINPNSFVFYDIFTGEEVDVSKYKLLDIIVTQEDDIPISYSISIKYKTDDNEVKLKQLNLLYPYSNIQKSYLEEKSIGDIAKIYTIRKNDFENEYFFFVYNKEGTEIVYYDYNRFYADITNISDDIIEIATASAMTELCTLYYNIETNTFSDRYIDVMVQSKDTVVYLTYENDFKDVCVNISDLFGTYTKKYVLDKKYTEGINYNYNDMIIKDDKLIIRMNNMLEGSDKDEYVEYPIK